MARLTYITNMSLDCYIEDRHGAFDFGPMDDDLFAAYTELLGTVGTFLYGRRLYETMAGWENLGSADGCPEVERDYLGGRGAIAWLLSTRLNEEIAPLSAENLLVFGAGPLAGTASWSCWPRWPP